MKPFKTLSVLFIVGCLSISTVWAQQFDENFVSSKEQFRGYNYEVHVFRMGESVRAEYFAMDAKTRYENWYYNKTIMIACSGAFSETWETDSKPVGLTIEDGRVKNRVLDPEMDALIMVAEGQIFVMDLDELAGGFRMDDGSYVKINPRGNYEDRELLIKAATEGEYTIFQSQLVYSKDRNDNFRDLYYGKRAERRFLVTASFADNYYNIIVDAPNELELNVSARNTKDLLEEMGYTVQYIINLDTGGKNIFLVRESWENLTYKADNRLHEATNLLVFYTYD